MLYYYWILVVLMVLVVADFTTRKQSIQHQVLETNIQELTPESATSSSNSIFVVVCYNCTVVTDAEIIIFLERLFSSASDPSGVFVGVCIVGIDKTPQLADLFYETYENRKSWAYHIRETSLDIEVGAMVARDLVIQKCYRGEKYLFSIGTNLEIQREWDKLLINNLQSVYPHHWSTHFFDWTGPMLPVGVDFKKNRLLPSTRLVRTKPSPITRAYAATWGCLFTVASDLSLEIFQNSLPMTDSDQADFLLTAQLVAKGENVFSGGESPVCKWSKEFLVPSLDTNSISLLRFTKSVLNALVHNQLLSPMPRFLGFFQGSDIEGMWRYFGKNTTV